MKTQRLVTRYTRQHHPRPAETPSASPSHFWHLRSRLGRAVPIRPASAVSLSGYGMSKVSRRSRIQQRAAMLTIHRLTAGDGYKYLLRHVAAGDVDRRMAT